MEKVKRISGAKHLCIQWILIILFMVLISCQKRMDSMMDDDVAIAEETQTENLLAYGRTHNERRYIPLQNINTSPWPA
jgi:glucose dehydrogenase